MKASQAEKILEYLKTGRTLNPREAQELFNCWRLGDVAFKLRKRGWPVVNLAEPGEFGRYSLEGGRESGKMGA